MRGPGHIAPWVIGALLALAVPARAHDPAPVRASRPSGATPTTGRVRSASSSAARWLRRARLLRSLRTVRPGRSPSRGGPVRSLARSADGTAHGGAIEPHDFTVPLARAGFRALDASLSDADFAAKWRSAHESPLMFLRSFPQAFYADLRVLVGRAPGGRGRMFGDLHPDNFGFLRLPTGTRYAYNDLDDSGTGPVAFDALRYFTALRLAGVSDETLDEALDAYAATAVDPHGERPGRPPEAPHWPHVAARRLERYTRGDGFAYGEANPDFAPASDGVRREITGLIATGAEFEGGRVLDVAERSREHGGSAGLPRYWVLLERAGARTVLEFKAAERPAVEQLGVDPDAPPPDLRIAQLKQTFWGAEVPHDWFYRSVGGRRFLVRDRLHMESVEREDLSHDAQQRLYRYQAGLAAEVHAPAWRGIERDEIHAWLRHSSAALAERWTAAYRAAATPP